MALESAKDVFSLANRSKVAFLMTSAQRSSPYREQAISIHQKSNNFTSLTCISGKNTRNPPGETEFSVSFFSLRIRALGRLAGIVLHSVCNLFPRRLSMFPKLFLTDKQAKNMNTSPEGQQVTQLLRAWGEGDAQALNQLVPLVESELQRLARLHLLNERQGHTLQAPDLVNEVYLRLLDLRQVEWENRAQFFRMAARLMRHVLVDYARSRNYQKRGGGEAIRVSLVHAAEAGRPQELEVMALHDALTALEKFDPQGCQIVEMKFFGGLQVEEIAGLMGLSERTVARKWENSRAWLYREMTSGQ